MRWPICRALAGWRAEAQMALVLDNLSCRRGGRVVFSGLSFTVDKGQAALVHGPNGSGKSTLLRVVAGLLPAVAGDVRLGDAALLQDRARLQDQLAFAGHLDAVKPALTVRANLAAWAGILGADRVRIGAALARFGLERIADRPVVQCSAGQRRRLGLARLLLVDRKLWLLDEPTVSLDAASVVLLVELVREHVALGGIALIASHVDLGLGETPILDMGVASRRGAGRGAVDEFLEGSWA